MNYYMLAEQHLVLLEALSKRLFTENRMDGNEMRDAAQLLESVVRVSRQLPVITVEERRFNEEQHGAWNRSPDDE